MRGALFVSLILGDQVLLQREIIGLRKASIHTVERIVGRAAPQRRVMFFRIIIEGTGCR